MIPTAVWVFDTPEATVVAMAAHLQSNLLDAMICRHVKRFMLLTYFHHLNSFVIGDIEQIQKLRPGLSVEHELNDFVNATVVGADVKDFKLLVGKLIA